MIDRLLGLIPSWAWFSIVVGLSALSGFLFYQKLSAKQEILSVKLELSKLETKIEEANKESEQKAKELSNKVIEAQNDAIKRQAILKADAASAHAALDSLRKQIATNITGAPAITGTEHAAALAVLFGECAQRYTDLGEKADGHASDVKTLIDAWPK